MLGGGSEVVAGSSPTDVGSPDSSGVCVRRKFFPEEDPGGRFENTYEPTNIIVLVLPSIFYICDGASCDTK